MSDEIKDIWRNIEHINRDISEIRDRLPDMQTIKRLENEVDEVWLRVNEISKTQSTYVNEHHKLEMQILEIRTDLAYIRKAQDSLSGGINKVLYAIGTGFIVAFVAFIVRGGLS